MDDLPSTAAHSETVTGESISVPQDNVPLGTTGNGDGACKVLNLTFAVMPFIVSTLGLIGNGLTITILSRDISKSATLFLLYCLAIADSVFVVAYVIYAVPPALLTYFGLMQEAVMLNNYLRIVFVPILPTCLMTSMSITVAVTWQRFVSVCMPYKAKKYVSLRWAKIMAAAIPILAFIFNFPKWFENKITYDHPRPGMVTVVPTDLFKNKTYQLIYGAVLFYLVFYIVPLGSLIFMTIALIRALHENRLKRKKALNVTESTAENQAKQEITLSLVMVVVVFILSYCLQPVRHVLIYLYPEQTRSRCSMVYYFSAVATFVTITNSCINIIIYILCVSRFRKQVKRLFGCARIKVEPEWDNQSQSVTSNQTASTAVNSHSVVTQT